MKLHSDKELDGVSANGKGLGNDDESRQGSDEGTTASPGLLYGADFQVAVLQ
jgi:hypothetical protein